VGGVVGFTLLQGRPGLIGFTILSLLGFPIAVSLLWIDWIHSRDVRFSTILAFILTLYWIPMSWAKGHHIITLVLIAYFSIGVFSISRKLFGKGNVQIGGRA
jgi:hypothetical protein